MFNWFGKKQNNCLGIDFGAFGIKVVELSRVEGGRLSLVNYAIAQIKPESNFSIVSLDADQVAAVLKKILDQAGIKTRQAVVSLSMGETFSTIISVPQMSEEELAKAIPFQARKFVPVPIEEVELDWSVLGEYVQSSLVSAPTDSAAPSQSPEAEPSKKEAEEPFAGGIKMLQVLIVAVPLEVINKIVQISKKADLKVLAVEQEVFSIIRSLIGNDEGGYLIADLGQESIDLIVMDKGSIRLTYAFEKDRLTDLVSESAKLINTYQSRYNRKIGRVILIGDWTNRFDWKENFGTKLGIPVGLGDPFARVTYDSKIGQALKEIGPFMTVAVGGAMREI